MEEINQELTIEKSYPGRGRKLRGWGGRLVWGAAVFLALPPLFCRAEAPGLPFSPGEKLIFNLKWEFVHAGTTTIEVGPPELLDGQRAHRLVMTAETNSFVDVFYKVRDRIESFVNEDMTHTLLYNKQQREGRTRRQVIVRFDWEKGQATYSNYGKELAPIVVQPGSFDPLASFYFIRTLDLQPGMVIDRPLTDGKTSVVSQVRVLGEEEVKVPAGTFQTIRFEPDLRHARGVFEKSRKSKMTVWVTADRRHIPVKITSKVVVGSFIGELIGVEGVQELEPSP